ncbi:MAG TPA: hypothetical protein VMT20_16285 [Terriglobia bacterium]|nr:hypothetical protein [Terriglobia bacterium]
MRIIQKHLSTIAILAMALLPAAATGAFAASKTSNTAVKNEKAETSHAAKDEVLGPAETLTGTITAVDHHAHLVVLKDSAGIPLDLRVTRSTRIVAANNSRDTMRELNNDVGKQASVTLLPERSGDFARDIHIQAG